MPKAKYSAKERKAYHMGRAYATAKAGKRVVCPDEATKQSFRNGVNDVRNRKSVKKSTADKSYKGGKNKGGFCYVVNSDGEIVDVMKC
mgnify:CR=1 FL=1